MCRFFYYYLSLYWSFFDILGYFHFLDKKLIFLPKIWKNFKFFFLNDVDLPPVRTVYHTSRVWIRNVALLNVQNSAFSVFSVRKERKVEKSPNRGPTPYCVLISCIWRPYWVVTAVEFCIRNDRSRVAVDTPGTNCVRRWDAV